MISYQYEHRRRALHSPVLLHEAIAGGDGGGGVLKQPRAARTPEQDVEQRHSVPGIKTFFQSESDVNILQIILPGGSLPVVGGRGHVDV